MLIRSNVKAGDVGHNHNEKIAKDNKSFIIKTGVKARVGSFKNHNEKMASYEQTRSLTSDSGVKSDRSGTEAVSNLQYNERPQTDNETKSLFVKTSIKAGSDCGPDCGQNHNERLTSDINTIEQKKSLGNKLQLNKETIRALTDSDLRKAIGGARGSVVTQIPPADGAGICAGC